MSQKFYSMLLVLLSLVIVSNEVIAAAPSTQASYISFSSVNETSMRISWINGNGGNRIVTITPAGETVENPVDGTNYSADTDFLSSATINTHTRVVYNGSGRTRTVLVSNLSSSTSYTVKVFEYNFSGGQRTYQTADANNNPRGIKTAIAAPTNISFANVGAYSADVLWEGGNSTDMVLSLYDLTDDKYHLYYEESNLGDVSYGAGSSYSFTLQDLDLNGASHTFGIRLKSKDGSEESAWYPSNFTSSTFQTVTDATPPTFTYSIFTDNGASTAASGTLTPGTYYVKVVSSELLNTNPEIKFQPDAADNSDGTDFEVLSSTITNTLSDTEWLYTLTIPSANYDTDNSVNSETTTFTITGDDYALNSGTVTNIDGGTGFASYYIDNRPPADLSVALPSGTFGINETVAATITILNGETSATFGSMTFNGVDVADENNFEELGGGNYSVSYTISAQDTDTEATTNWTSLSFSMIDEHGNSSTYIATAAIDGGNTLTVDANSPTISMVYLPSGSFTVNEEISLTFTALGAGEWTSLTTGEFNGQSLSDFTYVGGAYQSNVTSTFSATYTVQEGDDDILAGSGLTFSLAFTDQAGNLGLTYNANTITPNNAANFNVDANSPVINALYLPSSTFGIGDVVTATFTMSETDLNDLSYIYTSASINGVLVDNTDIYRIGSSTSYTASYTVVENDGDQIDIATQTTTGMRFVVEDSFGNESNTVTAAESTGNITIDATKPVITAAWIPESGASEYGIGSTFNVDIVFTETDDVTLASATFNTANLTSSLTETTATYTLVYTVGDGHPNIFNANSVPGTFTVSDRAGNSSTITNINANVIGGGQISIVGTRPLITNLYVPAGTFTVGDDVSVTFTTNDDNFTNSAHTFTFAGEEIETADFTNLGSNSYSASFTVADGGTDVDGLSAGSASLTYMIQTSDTFGNASLTYNQNTLVATLTTGNGGGEFIIDANLPTISSVSIPSGNYKVGSVISATITTDSDIFGNYVLTGASASINNIEITDFTNLNSTSYSVTYTVGEGNTDRTTLASIPTWFRVQDVHGNTSETFTGNLSSTGAVTIDANTPTINSVTVDGGSYGIDDVITFRVEAGADYNSDQPFGPNSSATITINGVNVPTITRIANTSTTYTGTLTVTEGLADRASVGDIPISVRIKDPNGNVSAEYTTAPAVSPATGASVQIDATSASITAMYLPSGTFIIDDNVTVTFTVANTGTLSDANYLNSAHTFTINGYPVTTFANLGSNSYSAVWAVEENQEDHTDESTLTFTISTSDTFGNTSLVYNSTSITPAVVGGDGDFIIDANRPSIASATVSEGLHGIDLVIPITFEMVDAEDNTGITLVNASSSFNGQAFNGAITGGPTYQLQYTIDESHNNVATINDLSATITVMDKNGNSSLPTNPFWSPNTIFTVSNSGTFRIDTDRPTIDEVFVSGGDYGIGSTVTIVVTTTDNYNDLLDLTSASFNLTSIPTSRWERNSNSYTTYYVVAEGDNEAFSTATQATTTFNLKDESENTIATTTYTIDSNGEVAIDASPAVISAIDFASQSHKVGDIVSFTFTADYSNYANDAHSFTVNSITMTAANFNNIGSNSYTGTFTVSENDNDVDDIDDLWYSISTSDTFGNVSDSYEPDDITPTGAAFSIDANSPTISSVVVASDNYKIGDEISMTFTLDLNETDEANTMILVPSSSSFNGKPITNFTKLDDETYAGTYTVVSMDNDVENISALSATITVEDIAGNISNSLSNQSTSWSVEGGGVFSIIANAPTITAFAVESGIHGATDVVSGTITTTGSSALSEELITVNGNNISDFGEITSMTSYSFTFPVNLYDTEHGDVSSLSFTMSVVDNNENYSATVTQGNFLATTASNFIVDASPATITGVNYAANTYKIGDIVSATFEMDQNNYDEDHISINGQTATNYTQIGSSNSYSVTYTVVEGDENAANVGEIEINAWVKSTTFTQVEMNSATYTTPGSFDYYTSTGAISIDANRPYVDAITFEGGKYGIGSTLTATFTARTKANNGTIDGTQPLEAGLSLVSASINGFDVSGSFADIGSGSYTLSYVITEDETDRADADSNEVKIVVADAAGNESNNNGNEPRDVYSTGNTSIDAHRPVISAISVEASTGHNGLNTHIIGDEITINIAADADSFSGINYTSGTISINSEDEGASLSHNSGTYTFTYTVTEGNTDRTSLNSTPMTFTLVDDHGNESLVSTQNDATLVGGSDFKIDANRPTVNIQYHLFHNTFDFPIAANNPTFRATNENNIKITTSEAVRHSTSTPSGSAPTIRIDSQGDANDRLTATAVTHVGTSTTFRYNRPTIVEDDGTDGLELESMTFTLTDLAGNTSTVAPSNSFTRYAYIDATVPSFTFTYFTDAGFTTPVPTHGRLKAGTYYVRIDADEIVQPSITFTIVNPDDNGEYGVEAVIDAGSNTTSHSYTRVISNNEIVAGLSSETYTVSAIDEIGNVMSSNSFSNSNDYLIYVDTQKPTATVTLAFENDNADIVTRDNPSATVSVVYDEDMDTNNDPSVTFTNNPIMISNNDGSWMTSRTYTESFTHDLTEEIINNVSATINTTSGATDVAGNTDIGDSSPTFTVNTETAIASASITLTVFNTEDVVNYNNRDVGVIVWYDRDMDTGTTPSITFSNEANFAGPNDDSWTNSRTWSATYTHSGIEFKANESATVSGTDTNGARDNVGNLARGVESSTFRVDTEIPEVTINNPTSSNQNSATIGNSSVTFTYVVDYSDNDGLDNVALTNNDVTVNYESGNITSHSVTVANNGTNSSTVSIFAGEGDGELSIKIGDGIVTDNSGNSNTMSATSATIVIDNTAPTIDAHSFVYDIVNQTRSNTLTVEVSGADYNNAATASFTLVTAGATGGDINTASNGSTSEVNVTFDDLSDDGSASITMQAGVFSDIAGNITPEFTSNGIEVDNIAPTLVAPLTINNIDNTQMWFTSSEGLYSNDDETGLITDGDFDFDVTGGNATYNSSTVSTGNNGVEFNSTDNHYIGFADDVAFDNDKITIELWFKQDVAGLQFLTGRSIEHTEIHLNGDQRIRFIPTTGIYIDSDDFVYNLGEWTHISYVYDPAQSLAKLYVNGIEENVNTTGSLNTSISNSNSNLWLGIRGDNLYEFDGAIDEVRIWNDVRTANEIEQNYSKGLNGNEDGLVFYATLNDINDLDDLANNITGTKVGASITNTNSINLSNSTTFTFNADWTGEFNGSEAITISANNNTSLYDRAGNALLSSSTVGRNALVRPTVSFNAPTPQYVNTAGTATFTIDLTNTANNNLISDDFTLIHSGTGAGTINYVGGDLTTGTFTVTGLTGNGSSSVTVDIDGVLSPEGYGNLSKTTTTPIEVDNVNPMAMIANPSLTYTNSAGTFTYLVNYSDDNSGLNSVTLTTDDITFDEINGTITSKSYSVSNNGINSSTITLWAFEGSGDVAIKVGAGIVTDNANNSNTATGFSDYVTIDNTPPSATLTITRNGTVRNIANDGKSMLISATFNEPMDIANNVELDIDVPGVGDVANGVMTRVSATSYTYTWVVNNAGDGAATFTFDGGTDLANNAIASGTTTVDPFTVDNTAPTLQEWAFTNADNTSGTITFSENVYTGLTDNYGTNALGWVNDFDNPSRVPDVGAAQFQFVSSLNHTAGTPSMTFTSGIFGTSDGTERYVLNGKANAIYDLAGNVYLSSSTASATLNKKTTVQDITISTADGYYKEGDIVDFKVEFDRNVTADPSVAMALNSGGSATYSSGNNSKTITLRYTVGAGDNSSDLAHSATTSITPANAFTDDRTFEVNQTLPATTVVTNDHAVEVDTDLPTITIGLPNITEGNNSNTYTYELTYADASSGVSVVNTTDTDISVENIGTTVGNISVTNTGTTSGTVTLWNVTGDGSIAIKVIAGAISDEAGNENVETGNSNTITIDNTPPVVAFDYFTPSDVNSSGTAIFVFSATDANNNNLASNSFTLVHNGTAGGSINYIGGTTSSATVSVTGLTGDGSTSITMLANAFTDNVNNGSLAVTSEGVNVDNTAPTVTINNPNPNVVNQTGTTTFTITANGADNNNITDNTSFGLVYNGTAGAGVITYEGGDASSATVTVTGLTGDGSASLTMNANAFTDLAGNGNASSTSTNGVEVDNTKPTITFISAMPNLINSNGTATFTYTVNGASANTAMSSSFTVENNDGDGNVVNVSTSGNGSGTVTVTGLTGDGQAGIDMLAGVYTDAAGNSNDLTSSATISVDNTKPTVTINAPSIVDANSSSTFTYTIDYADANGINNVSLTGGDINFDGITPNNHMVANGANTSTVTIWGAMGDGHLAISLDADIVEDNAGNTNDATGNSATVTIDNTAPVITFNPVMPSAVNSVGTATFTYDVTGADNFNVNSSSFTVNYGSGAATLVGSDVNSGTVTVTGLNGDGSASITIAANAYTDNAGNMSVALTSGGVIVDNTAPMISDVSIYTDNLSMNRAKVGDLVSVTFTSDESLNSGNGALAGRTGLGINNIGGMNYSTSISVLGTDTEGSATFNITVTDMANNNTMINLVDDASVVTIDYTAPTGTITVVNNTTLNLENSSLTVTVNYDDNMLNTTTPDISIGAGATYTSTSANWTANNEYTAIYNVTGNVEVNNINVTLDGKNATDIAGNQENEETTFNNTFNVDRIAPNGVISSNSGTLSSDESYSATITFNEAITGLAVTDALMATNATATVTSVITAGEEFEITVHASSEGTVNVWLAANDVFDAVNNPNANSNTLTYEFDNGNPDLNSLTMYSDNMVGGTPYNNYATDGGVVTFDFEAAEQLQNVSMTITSSTNDRVIIPTNPSADKINWSASFTVDNNDPEGLVSFDLYFEDLNGNFSNTMTTTDMSSVTVDRTAPSASITISTVEISNTFTSMTVTLTTDDERVKPGEILNFINPSANFTSATVSEPSPTLTRYILTHNGTQESVSGDFKVANTSVITNKVGLTSSTTSELFTLHVDTDYPEASFTAVSGASQDPIVYYNINWDQDVDGFEVGDITIGAGGTGTLSSTLTQHSSSSYSLAISGMTASGNISATITANSVLDNTLSAPRRNANLAIASDAINYTFVQAYTSIALNNNSASSTVSMGTTHRALTAVFTDDNEGSGQDLFPTKFTGLYIGKTGGYDLNDVISSATFFNSSNTNLGTATIGSNTMSFTFAEQTIADNASATYYVNYTLKNTSTYDIDNTELVFTLDGDDFVTSNNSTPFETATKSTDDFNVNTVKVNSTKLIFSSQPQDHSVGNGATFTVKATDANNNLDKDFTGEIRIVSTFGKATATDSTENAVSGAFAFNSYKFNDWKANATISAQATGLTSATSNAFNIRANAPAAATGVSIAKVNNNKFNVSWTPSSKNGVHNKALVFVKINTYTSNLGLNDESAMNSTAFSISSNYGTSTGYLSNHNAENGFFVLSGQGDPDGTTRRKVTVTYSSSVVGIVWGAGVYMYDGDASNLNTVSYNTSQDSYKRYLSKEIFGDDKEVVSKSNLFSVGSINPNPVKDEFNINMTLNETMDVTIDLYSTAGELIGSLYNANSLDAGQNIIFMNMSNFNISQGTYMLQVKAGDEVVMLPFVYQK